MIILMSLPVPIHAVIAILRMPRGYGDRIVKAHEIAKAITGNAYVTIAAATITAILALIDTYVNANTSALRKAAFVQLTTH